MNKTYSTTLSPNHVDWGILIFRIGISALMLTHGIPKLIRFFGPEELKFADPIGIGELLTFSFAVLAEFLCSVLVLVGLGTRLAVIPLIITMAVAAIVVNAPAGLARQELPLLYLLSFILLFFTGSGKYSLDGYFLQTARARKK